MSIVRLFILLLVFASQSTTAVPQETLGRLFFTPQQRAALDHQRQLNRNFVPNSTDGESSLTFNGEVRRSGGRSTRWINGEADWDNRTPAPRVPVGDTFLLETGERQSVLGEGRISIKTRRDNQ